MLGIWIGTWTEKKKTIKKIKILKRERKKKRKSGGEEKGENKLNWWGGYLLNEVPF